MSEPAAAPGREFFHPLSGVAILGLDWLFFGLGWEFGPVSLALACAASFAACFAVVRRVQLRYGGDTPERARWKALLGAAAAGAPFAVGGTILGGAILALSGLRRRPRLSRGA